MNLIIPFSKDIDFKTNISEISSISLEHNYTVNDGELLGNFEVSGEYKTHEVSVNKEPFNYVLPFSVDIASNINLDTIDFAIVDFTYEIIDNNTLRVNIEYSVQAEENNNLERVEIKDAEELERLIEIEEENEKKNEEQVKIEEDEKLESVTKEELINSINKDEESFVTYNIHIIKENEDIDSLCAKYKTNKDILELYNDITNIKIGDKIIIPEIDE